MSLLVVEPDGGSIICPQLLGQLVQFVYADKLIGVTIRVSGAGGRYAIHEQGHDADHWRSITRWIGEMAPGAIESTA